jgi:tetratricopeptide (TPR) repeat protein
MYIDSSAITHNFFTSLVDFFKTRKVACVFIPLFLFLFAFFLRTSGLSHDLHLGHIYHPDTPKQIRVVERFLNDDFGLNYYRHIDHPDYDGYPAFNSHLVEWLCRGYALAREAALQHVGIPPDDSKPDLIAIYWTTRLLNSFFSAMAVVLIYFMGLRHFGLAAGLVAALLLSFSPVDITTSNFAMSDSTAAFFALLAVFLALRIAESPRIVFYIFGGMVAAFAFSAKYQGGMALFPLGVAHLLAFPQPRMWLSLRFWLLGLALPLSFVVGVFLSSPSLLIYPSGAFKDILGFLEFSANYGLSAEMRDLPLWSRFLLSMRLNIPKLFDYLGWFPLLAILGGMLWFRRNKFFWIVLSLPFFFFLVGLSTRPMTFPDYFTTVTSLLLLAGAISFSILLQPRVAILPTRALFLFLSLFSMGYLANYAWHEIFFFRHNDTRRVMETWALDNIPREFHLIPGMYTFGSTPWEQDRSQSAGRVYVLSDRTAENPRNASLMFQTDLEQRKLSRNRNWNIRFLIEPNDYLSSEYSLPVVPRRPASRQDNLILADAPALMRSPKVIDLAHRESFKATLASPTPLRDCAFVLRNDDYPAEVSIRFGRKRQQVVLSPHETVVLFFPNPASIPLSRNTNYFYSLEIKSHFNRSPVRVTMATSDLDMARELFLAGEYAHSYDFFLKVPSEELNVSESLTMIIAGVVSGMLKDEKANQDLENKLHPVFNHQVEPDLNRSGPPSWDSSKLDAAWFFKEFGVHPEVFKRLFDYDDTEIGPFELLGCQFQILHSLLASKPDAPCFSPSAWRILLSRGDALARQKRYEQALAFYRASMELEHNKRYVYEALERIRPFLPEKASDFEKLLASYRAAQEREFFPIDIRFANGLGILGYQVNSLTLRTDQHFEIALLWDVPKLRSNLYQLMYRVKLTDTQTSRVIFDEHFHFVRSVMKPKKKGDYFLAPQIVIPFDESTPPGSYELSIAMVLPGQDRVLRLRKPRSSKDKKYANVVRITIEDGGQMLQKSQSSIDS